MSGPHNYQMNLEEATDAELADLRNRCRKLHGLARQQRERGADDMGSDDPDTWGT